MLMVYSVPRNWAALCKVQWIVILIWDSLDVVNRRQIDWKKIED